MKHTLLCIACLLLSVPGFAQKRIVKNVKQDYYSIVRFDRIETDGKQTVADVLLQYIPGWWINVNSNAYLQESGGERRYRLLRVEGFPVDSNCHMPPSGERTAKFYFEPIDADVAEVDYREPGDESGLSQTLGIRLKPTEGRALPDALRGNWMSSDGGNEWIYGLWDGFAIYKNRFWNYKALDIKGSTARITLECDGEQIPLYVKAGKDNTLYASADGQPLVKLGREAVQTPSQPAAYRFDAEQYRDRLFDKKGEAVIRGFIDGYNPRLNAGTAIIYLRDEVFDEDTPVVVDIRPDGRFEAKVPMEYPKTLYYSGEPKMNFGIFTIPGDTLMMYVNLNEIVSAKHLLYRNGEHCTQHRYMGGTAGEYNYYRFLAGKMQSSIRPLYDRMKEFIAANDDAGFKQLALQRLRDTRDSLDAMFGRYRISGYTKNLLYSNMSMDALHPLLDYEMEKKDSKYLYIQDSTGKYISPRNENYRPLDSTFNDYLTPDILDNPLLVAMPSFWAYVNRIKYGDVVGTNPDNRSLIDYILSHEKNLPDSVRGSLEAMRPNEHVSWNPNTPEGLLIMRYFDRTAEIAFDRMQRRGIGRNLSFDYAVAQEVYSDVKTRRERGEVSPLWIRERISGVLPYVKTPYICARLLDLYAENTRPETQAAEDTKTSGERILDSLIAPYKGNVLYVDFWGISCGPCRAGMIDAKPIVKELRDHKIKFLYIASETDSPLDAYNKFIGENQIGGEHLRISHDDWNHLAAQYRINGIPHMMLIDKDGKILENDTGGNLNKDRLLELEAE